MSVPSEILLVEDEPDVREGLAVRLACEGYAVRMAADGEAALAAWRAHRPDLVLLDVMMPKKNGYAVCREIRASDAQVPIIFLTALSDDADELRGLDLGADDFVLKTEKPRILLARIAAALRRRSAANGAQLEPGSVFCVGDCRIDAANGRLMRPDGAVCELALREVEVLRAFARHPNEFLSHDYLLTRFWGASYLGDENALTVFMSRLRGKLADSGRRIQTFRGKGYCLVQ